MYRLPNIVCSTLLFLFCVSMAYSASPNKHKDLVNPKNCDLHPSKGLPIYCTQDNFGPYHPDPKETPHPLEKTAKDTKKKHATRTKKKTKKKKQKQKQKHATRTKTVEAHATCNYHNDDGLGEMCVCSGVSGAHRTMTLKPENHHGTNTGKNYNPCPWSTFPGEKDAKSWVSPTPTPAPSRSGYFTETVKRDIVACTSSVVSESEGYRVTHCAGSSVTVGHPPMRTVQVGRRKQNVGTLSGEELYTSISSALDSICPTPTRGSPEACKTDSVTIDGIEAVKEGVELKEGYLKVYVASSHYTDRHMRRSMIETAAITAQHSTNGTNCHRESYELGSNKKRSIWPLNKRQTMPGTAEYGHKKLCNAPSFAGVQQFDGKKEGPTDWMDAEWEFQVEKGEYNSGIFSCEMAVMAVSQALLLLGPEMAIVDTGLDTALTVVCEEIFENASS